MNNQLNKLGQQLFTWDTPDGYPDKIEYWAGNIVPRWSFAHLALEPELGDDASWSTRRRIAPARPRRRSI